MRWDSDHVVLFNDDTRAIAEEIIRHGFEKRVHIGLDFFDASINRIAAWTIGTRSTIKSLLAALLEPRLRFACWKTRGLQRAPGDARRDQDPALRRGVDYYCLSKDVPVGASWMAEVKRYEREVLSARS